MPEVGQIVTIKGKVTVVDGNVVTVDPAYDAGPDPARDETFDVSHDYVTVVPDPSHDDGNDPASDEG